MAVSLLMNAVERGDVAPGDTVVEFTGGSTGTALAFVAAVLGLNFTAVLSDAFSHSKRLAMEAFGATVLTEESVEGSITSELGGRMRKRASEIADQPGHHSADQSGFQTFPMDSCPWAKKSRPNLPANSMCSVQQ